MYNVYSSVEKSRGRYMSNKPIIGIENSSNIRPIGGLRRRLQGVSKLIMEYSSKEPIRSDLETYLDEPIIPFMDGVDEQFDILSWWRLNIVKYPILEKIAQDVLTIHMSTVTSESAFSIGEQTIGSTRNNLNPKTLEALIWGVDMKVIYILYLPIFYF